MSEEFYVSANDLLRIRMIRHGATPGNLLKRYIGSTDEELSEEGRESLCSLSFPRPQRLYVSPMKRCIQSAQLLFPGMEMRTVPELRECGFGEFENQNYQELKGNLQYQEWVDGFCEGPIPGGESKTVFQQRTLQGFSGIIMECIREEVRDIAVVAHGGTIMAVMEAWCKEKRPFYDWRVDPGGGYSVFLNKIDWMKGKKIFLIA